MIGSGITGCSISKSLFEHSSPASAPFSVTVLEARTLTSGATGRNGGLLTSFVPGDYKTLSERFGHEQAVKIARYANRTLDKMHELANSPDELKEASEARRLMDVICFEDEEPFRACLESWQLYEKHVPEDRGKAQFLSSEETLSKNSVRAAAGAMLYPNGAFWPYRLITRLWADLYAQYRPQLSIEAKTPVTEIKYDPSADPTHPYILHTPRGLVRASKVIHATNGYVGHLLPKLRGKIFSLRGTMSTQKVSPKFGNQGNELSWSVIKNGNFDSDSKAFEAGLYYSNQNAKTGNIFIGGEKTKIHELLISDDSSVSESCEENLSTLLPKIFTQAEGSKPEVIKIWSGIMGFTADRLPLIGCLPQRFTERGDGVGKESDEWIAAGVNGYGMPLCWSSGEAVARMLLGIDVGDFLPETFLATEERLLDTQRMSTTSALELLFAGHV